MHLLILSNNFMHLINARNMGHIKRRSYLEHSWMKCQSSWTLKKILINIVTRRHFTFVLYNVLLPIPMDTLSDQTVTLIPMNPWSVNLSGNRSLQIKQLLLNLYPPSPCPKEWQPCKITFSFQLNRQQTSDPMKLHIWILYGNNWNVY